MHPDYAAPGWREPGDLPAVLDAIDSYSPVNSVSIFRDNPEAEGEIETLTMIRGAGTHQGVVSTITSTFPPETLPVLLDAKREWVIDGFPKVEIGTDGPNPLESATLATYWPRLEGVPETTDLMSYYCHDVLARKLGRSDLISMRWDDELGTVSLARLALGVSYVGDNKKGEALYERLLMVGLAFMLHPHQSHVFDKELHEKMSVIPEAERRYTDIGWAPVRQFPGAVRSKDVFTLAPYIPETQAVTVCARGQCLAMTSELIGTDYELLVRHLGRSPLNALDTTGYNVGDPYRRRQER